MSEQRLRVESGPPQQLVTDTPPDASAPADDQPKAEQMKEKAQEVAGPAKEKAQEVAGQAKSQAQQAAGQAKEQAAAQVDEKSTQVGQQIGSQGDALQGVAGELRKQGKDGPANVAEQAAEKVKNVGDYLEQADGEKLVETAQQVARDNPAAAAAVGAAAGFAAGRVIKAALDDEEPQPGAPTAPDTALTEPGQTGTGAP
jgi:hypothetical protein